MDPTAALGLSRCFTFRSRRGQNNSDNESVKGKSLGENHHEDKGDQDISLSVSTDTSVTNNTNAETSGKGRQTTAKTSTKLLVTIVVTVGPLVWLRAVLFRVFGLGNYIG